MNKSPSLFPFIRWLHFWGLRGNAERWYRRLALSKSLQWTRVPKESWERGSGSLFTSSRKRLAWALLVLAPTAGVLLSVVSHELGLGQTGQYVVGGTTIATLVIVAVPWIDRGPWWRRGN